MENTKYQGKFIKVTEEEIGGNIWERVYLNDGVLVFPITKDGKIIMIEEKRPHEKKPVRLKFVTGLIDNNDDPLDTANREMQEEIGFKADHLEVLIQRESSGTINNNFYMIVATGLSESKIPNPDGEDTILGLKYFTLDELFEQVYQEEMSWSMATLGLFKIKHLIDTGKLKY